MRRFVSLAVVASAISFGQSAGAADMPAKAPRAPAVIPYSWTGFYVGANVGYTWGPWDLSASQIIFDPSTTHDAKVNGALGGVQLGYNWQAGSWVYGLEGDIQITGAKDTDNWSTPGAPVPPPPVIPAPPLADFLPGPPGGGTARSRMNGNFLGLERFAVVWAFCLRALAGVRDGRVSLRSIEIRNDIRTARCWAVLFALRQRDESGVDSRRWR